MAKNLKNLIFGSYKVIERDTQKQAQAAYWLCQCQYCNKIVSLRSDSIQKNPVCKCQKNSLVNFISNEFIVLEKTTQKAKDKCDIYKCQCQNCNNIEYIASNVLRSKRKHCSKCYHKTTTLIDLTGEQFGYLKVLRRDTSKEHMGHENDSYWICECLNCGSIKSIRGISLRKGETKSCGCIKSYGEYLITKLLQENNISFAKEYSFKDLIYKNPLRFDFAIFNKDGTLSHLIEFDGIQHFESNNTGWNTLDNLKQTQFRDQLKNHYCEEKGIKLIRIKYTETITIEKIMGWTE